MSGEEMSEIFCDGRPRFPVLSPPTQLHPPSFDVIYRAEKETFACHAEQIGEIYNIHALK